MTAEVCRTRRGLTSLVGDNDLALVNVATEPQPSPTPRQDAGPTTFNVKLSDAALRAIAERLFSPSVMEERRNPEGIANQLAYWQRALELIGEDNPQCLCGACCPCLARGALAGPKPGSKWHDWEAMREVNRERQRERPERAGTVSRKAVEAALNVLKQAVA